MAFTLELFFNAFFFHLFFYQSIMVIWDFSPSIYDFKHFTSYCKTVQSQTQFFLRKLDFDSRLVVKLQKESKPSDYRYVSCVYNDIFDQICSKSSSLLIYLFFQFYQNQVWAQDDNVYFKQLTQDQCSAFFSYTSSIIGIQVPIQTYTLFTNEFPNFYEIISSQWEQISQQLLIRPLSLFDRTADLAFIIFSQRLLDLKAVLIKFLVIYQRGSLNPLQFLLYIKEQYNIQLYSIFSSMLYNQITYSYIISLGIYYHLKKHLQLISKVQFIFQSVIFIYNLRSNNKNYRRMSIIVSNCDQICQSPTNNSKAKMLYTFSKEDRFPKRKIIMCDKFYDTEKSPARSTTLGFGHKYDFTKDLPKSPPPNIYNLKSDFDLDKKKGFGFGSGRTQMQITGPFLDTIRNKNPGPGVYELKSTLDQNSFSLRGKNYHEDHEKMKLPGPGTYPVCFPINESGEYFLSKFKNSCVRNFKTNYVRGKTFQNKIPGPGAYDMTQLQFSPDGKYCLSRMPSVLSRRFGTSQRPNIIKKCETPGPGNYRLPSQFGHYCAKNALKKPLTQGNGRRNAKSKRQLEVKIQSKQNKQNKQNQNR